jgi:hypothetical protein
MEKINYMKRQKALAFPTPSALFTMLAGIVAPGGGFLG